MQTKFTRFAAVAAALAVATVGLITTNAAAAPALGTNVLVASTGTANTIFTLTPPVGASCTGSGSGVPAYRWQTFFVSAAVDASTLTYASGPNAVAGQFVSPLYDSVGTPILNRNPASSPLGLISGIPTMSLSSLIGAVGLVDGAYKIGFACTQAGALDAGKYWETAITIGNVTATGFTYALGAGAAPVAPVLAGTLTPGDQTLGGSFTAALSTPTTTGYTVTAVPASGPTVTVPVAAVGAFTLTGLVNGTSYAVTVTGANGVGTSVNSNTVNGTPSPPVIGAPVLTATSGVGQVVLSWTTPVAPGAATLSGYTVIATPTVAGSPFSAVAGVNTLNVPAPGGSYSFTVQAIYTPVIYVGAVSNAASASSNNAQTLIQDLMVVRPAGALVLTQRCGVYGSAAAVSDNVFGPLALLLASPATADPVDATTGYTFGGLPTGSAPLLTVGGSGDPVFGGYPYPVDAVTGLPNPSYPTRCGIDLGTGKLITSGPKAGQYFTATGRMAQITVVNTQDVDGGWTLNGRMSTFTRTGGGDSFSGNLLGWNPEVTYDSAPNLDGYDMVVLPGGVREATSTASTTGLGAASNDVNTTQSQSLAKSAAFAGTAPGGTGSLGMAVIDARLRLLIPVSANSGTYTGTLTFTTV